MWMVDSAVDVPVNSLVAAAFALVGWVAGLLVGGSHEWGWRVAVLVVLWVVAVAVRVRSGS